MTVLEKHEWERIFQQENVVQVVSSYFDLQSLTRFACVAQRSFPICFPSYLSTSPETHRVNMRSLLLCQSPSFCLRGYSCDADFAVIRALQAGDMLVAEQHLMKNGEKISSACFEYALENTSFEFDCAGFFSQYGATLDLSIWHLLFSKKTDRYFPVRLKESTLRDFLLAQRDFPLGWNQLLFASSIDSMQNAAQMRILHQLAENYYQDVKVCAGDPRDAMQVVLSRIDAPLQSQTCRRAVGTWGLGLSRSLLDFLVPLAITVEPLDFSRAWQVDEVEETIQLEACRFFLSLPQEAIRNRRYFLSILLRCASSAVVYLLLALPPNEIGNRASALSFRISNRRLRMKRNRNCRKSYSAYQKEKCMKWDTLLAIILNGFVVPNSGEKK